MGVLPVLGMIVTGAVAEWGDVMLSKDHPGAAAEREIAAAKAAAEATRAAERS